MSNVAKSAACGRFAREILALRRSIHLLQRGRGGVMPTQANPSATASNIRGRLSRTGGSSGAAIGNAASRILQRTT